jgi:starch-binding outer membrane protein, SusD/RagB family
MNKLKNNFKLLIPALVALVGLLYACGTKFLDKPPIGTLDPSIVANSAGIQAILIGAYAGLDGQGLNNSGWGSAADNWAYAEVAADNSYKGSTPSDQGDIVGLFQWDCIPTNSYPAMKWAVEYDAIQRSNDVIRTFRIATGVGSDTTEWKAEALFLRAFYHFELEKVFQYPPYVDESITYNNGNLNVPNVDGSGNYISIWPRIEADFEYAMANLPATQPNKGQANKYAAEAFLAKAYMFQAKYDSAKPLLLDLINNGETAAGTKYGLDANYSTLFDPDPAAKNGSESVFAAQMSVNDGSASGGGSGKAYGDALNFPYGAGPGACCGFDNPSQDLANAYKTDVNGLPLIGWASTNLQNFQTGLSVSDPAGAWTGNVDPRIDIVIGRKGIPYLDWGPMPGDSWIRSPADDGHFVAKKNVYAKSQQGSLSDNESFWANVELDANNVNLIRFADVLLWYAECDVLGSSQNLGEAETYVNMIRTRAANTAWWVYSDGTFDGPTWTYKGGTTPADSYKVAPYPGGYFATAEIAMEAIIMERRIELAEEGHRWFDLARFDATVAAAGVPTNGGSYMSLILNNYQKLQAPIHPTQYSGVSFGANRQYFPIPQTQVDAENSSGKVNLKQIPGY